MIQTKQTRFGADGNFWAACLATIFEVPLEDVDHCACNNSDWWKNTEQFLKERGLWQLQIDYTDNKVPFVAPPDNTICCIYGKCRGSSLDHVIVARIIQQSINENQCNLEYELIHDPLGVGPDVLETIKGVIFFVKRF